MDLLLLIGWIIFGAIAFLIVNKVFNITYFGFSGMVSVFIGCMAAVAIGFYFVANFAIWLTTIIVGFITNYYKWLIGAVILLVILAIWGSKSDSNKRSEEMEGNNTLNQ